MRCDWDNRQEYDRARVLEVTAPHLLITGLGPSNRDTQPQNNGYLGYGELRKVSWSSGQRFPGKGDMCKAAEMRRHMKNSRKREKYSIQDHEMPCGGRGMHWELGDELLSLELHTSVTYKVHAILNLSFLIIR